MWVGIAVAVMTAAVLPRAVVARQLVPPPSQPATTPAPAAEQPGGNRSSLVVVRKPGEPPLIEVPFVPLENVQVRGTGAIPLILIPAHGMDWRIWESFMERNEKRYTMYAINPPGTGGTTAPAPMPLGGFYSDGPWTLNLERGILHLIEEKKLGAPYVMGQGYGGHVAIRMVMRHPDKVSGAISLDGSVTVMLPNQSSPKMAYEKREAFVGATIRAGERISEADFMDRQKKDLALAIEDPARASLIAATIDGCPKASFLQYLGEYYAADLWPGLPELKKPIVVMVPLPDESLPAAIPNPANKARWAKWFLAAKDNCDLVWIEKCRPFIAEEAPAELDRAVYALSHGMHVQGRSKYSTKLDTFIAPEEGGPPMTPALRNGGPSAPEAAVPAGAKPGADPAPGDPSPK